MRFRTIPVLTLSLICICGVLCAAKSARKASPASSIDLKRYLGKRWYGIYFMGRKIGYAEAEIKRIKYKGRSAVTVGLELKAEVAMLGEPQEMAITETRTYVLGEGLVSFFNETRSGGGVIKLSGESTDGKMRIRSKIGGVKKVSVTERPKERFEDYIAEERLVGKGARVGDEIRFTQYQPTLGKTVTAVSRVKDIELRQIQGVKTRVYLIETTLKEMGVTSKSLISADGEVLQTQVGGMFTMLLEDEKLAKSIDYRSDIILSSVIRPKKRITNPTAVRKMKVKINGIKDRSLLVGSDRQKYVFEPDGSALLTVSVEDLSGIDIPKIPLKGSDFANELRPTLFIQSNNPEIVKVARGIVGEERDAFKASTRIVNWVYKNLKKRFSASFSNALDVLASGSGDCTEHSVLYVALARAVGLPAREVSGIVYATGEHGFYYHQWAEAYVGEWIAVDPTRDQAQADATHIKFVSGDLFSQARLINLVGVLGIEILECDYDKKS